jgi:hypothetical protein
MVKALKLAINLPLENLVSIGPDDTQFLINKDKNRDRFLFTFPPVGAMSSPGPIKLRPVGKEDPTTTPVQRNQPSQPMPVAGLTVELSVKYVQKRKLRANFIKTGVSSSQGAKRSLVVVFRQV